MDDLDELLGGAFDIAPKITAPMSTEEHFMLILTEGKHQKIYNLRFHLHRELLFYEFLKKKNNLPRKNIIHNGVLTSAILSPLEYAKVLIEYAIYSQFAAGLAVAEQHGGKPIDLDKIVNMIADHDDIKNTINNTHSLR